MPTNDNYDIIYASDINTGEVDKSQFIKVSKGLLESKKQEIKTLNGKKEKSTYFTSKNRNDAEKAFFFFADNSNVEWGLDVVGKTNINSKLYELSTSHENSKNRAQSIFISNWLSSNSENTIEQTYHSHPGAYDPKTKYPAYPSGFDNKGNPARLQGDRAYINWMRKYYPKRTPQKGRIYVPSINNLIEYDTSSYSIIK